MAAGVAIDVRPEQPYKLRALRTRPDEAHIPLQHVDQLWEFVE
jgi:hypothetical protein